PLPLAGLSLGFCADGNCLEVATRKQTVYEGCGANTGENPADDQCAPGTAPQRDAYDYTGKQFDPENCSSGNSTDESPARCSPPNDPTGGMDYWRQHESPQVNAQPGIQEYEDPDPQGSPISQLPYPTRPCTSGAAGSSQ